MFRSSPSKLILWCTSIVILTVFLIPFTVYKYFNQIVKEAPDKSIAEVLEPINNLFIGLGFVAVLVIIALLVGGYFISRSAFSKINRIVDTISKINVDRLFERIPHQNGKDELGKIISSLNEMISRLDVSFQQMKQFSADASHELKTPLAVMRAQLENGMKSNANLTELRDTIAECLDETLRMSNIVESLLLLAKNDAGQPIIKSEIINLKDLIEQTFEESKMLASQNSILVSLTNIEDATISGDVDRLRQMLLNLIDNAIKYNHPNGKIEIGLWKENNRAKIIITDNGIGIPEEDIVRIFDRFYRVDKARSRERGGTGLGLAISKAIVEAHSGCVYVRSTPKKGTEFTVIIPLYSV
ncbi:MAG: hypothetical protein C0417_09975 [Chlorobiaceae bacterium]|nr:hypothetical protein [Chlorobiaceae bacterium]